MLKIFQKVPLSTILASVLFFFFAQNTLFRGIFGLKSTPIMQNLLFPEKKVEFCQQYIDHISLEKY